MTRNHFTATVIVFNSQKQVLMIHHNKLKVWLPPGGHIEENEIPDDAVLREIFEETGIKAEILLSKQDLELSDNDCKELKRPFTILLENIEGDWSHNHIDLVYICTALNEDYTIQKSEVSDIGWFSIEQINELKTYENVKQTIKKATKYIYKYEGKLFKESRKADISLSKYLSRHLRHKPQEINLTIDKNGWADIDELIEKSKLHKGRILTLEMIEDVVKNNDKQRFKISNDGKKIRANQGHSFEVDLELESITPPNILYHGTAKRFLPEIKRHGLLPMRRHHVHLSLTEETALQVGKRHGKPVILTIDSRKMHDNGYKFYLSENNVWLTENVPTEYILIRDL